MGNSWCYKHCTRCTDVERMWLDAIGHATGADEMWLQAVGLEKFALPSLHDTLTLNKRKVVMDQSSNACDSGRAHFQITHAHKLYRRAQSPMTTWLSGRRLIRW